MAATHTPDATATAADIGAANHTEHSYISDKSRYLARLQRIEGQARGIHRMVEGDTFCIDILTQVSALTKALESVALRLLNDHLKHCVIDASVHGGPVAANSSRKPRTPSPASCAPSQAHHTPEVAPRAAEPLPPVQRGRATMRMIATRDHLRSPTPRASRPRRCPLTLDDRL